MLHDYFQEQRERLEKEFYNLSDTLFSIYRQYNISLDTADRQYKVIEKLKDESCYEVYLDCFEKLKIIYGRLQELEKIETDLM